MNIEEYKQKIFERLKINGWGEVLKPFIFSLEFEKILTTLYNFTKILKALKFKTPFGFLIEKFKIMMEVFVRIYSTI